MDTRSRPVPLPQQRTDDQMTGDATTSAESGAALAVWTHTTKLDNSDENSAETCVLRGIE